LPFALALVVSASTFGCSPEVPSMPTYTKEVANILNAHCARCHSENLAGVLDPTTGDVVSPKLCHLNRFENVGDCTTGTCSYGASASVCAGMFASLITNPDDLVRMPKPPSDRLNDWEIDVLTAWAKNPVQ